MCFIERGGKRHRADCGGNSGISGYYYTYLLYVLLFSHIIYLQNMVRTITDTQITIT